MVEKTETDKLMGITEAELQAYADSESRETEIEAEIENSDFDDVEIEEQGMLDHISTINFSNQIFREQIIEIIEKGSV